LSLRSLLESILGRASRPEDQRAAFSSYADQSGLYFRLDPALVSALETGDGPALARIQYITLMMLLEQGVAEKLPDTFFLSSEAVAGLDDDAAEILQLPPLFNGRFNADIGGRTGHSSFRVRLAAQLDNTSVPYRIRGPFIELSDSESYRLTPAMLYAFKAHQVHEALQPEERGEGENLKLAAALQTAQRSGMPVELAHFDKLEVHNTESVGVTARQNPDGSLTLFPSFGDGSSQEELESRWNQLDLNEDKTGVMRIGNRIVILEPERIQAVREVLHNRRIPRDQVQEFVRSPSAFLDAALVDLDLGFSVRVEGVGRFVHMEFESGGDYRADWFQWDAVGQIVEVVGDLVQSHEDGEELKRRVEEAHGQGADSVHFRGVTIDVTDRDAVIHAIDKHLKSLANPEDAASAETIETPRAGEEPSRERLVVLLREADEINARLLAQAEQACNAQAHDCEWKALHREPYPHQREGTTWITALLKEALGGQADDLYRLQGALLADDMGLGKTFMTLVASNEYYRLQRERKGKERPTLVVAPLSLLENWRDEVELTFRQSPFKDVVILQSGADLNKFRIKGVARESQQVAVDGMEAGLVDPSAIRYALHIGPEAGVKRLDQERRLILTTYQVLRDYQFSLCSIEWGMVIFDEAQNIKNPNTLQTRSAKGLRADFKLLATGTPVENSLGDFWCLMDTAQPGLLGNWSYFRERWVKPIQQASPEERARARIEYGRSLRDAVGPFMLRRVKEGQLRGLPDKTILSGVSGNEPNALRFDPSLAVEMRGRQLQTYNTAIDKHRKEMLEGDGRAITLATLASMRRISLHPRLYDESALYAEGLVAVKDVMGESGKLEILLRTLNAIQARGEKVVLFMITKKLQRLLKYWLDTLYDLNISIINGDTAAVPKKSDVLSRKQLISRFEEQPGFNILIMSPVAAGVGLTVVGANHVVHLERHWNPAKEAQASDRVYRIGQERDVFVYLPALLHPKFDSFDVHLDRLLRGKIDLKDAVVTTDLVSEQQMASSLGLVD